MTLPLSRAEALLENIRQHWLEPGEQSPQAIFAFFRREVIITDNLAGASGGSRVLADLWRRRPSRLPSLVRLLRDHDREPGFFPKLRTCLFAEVKRWHEAPEVLLSRSEHITTRIQQPLGELLDEADPHNQDLLDRIGKVPFALPGQGHPPPGVGPWVILVAENAWQVHILRFFPVDEPLLFGVSSDHQHALIPRPRLPLILPPAHLAGVSITGRSFELPRYLAGC